MLLIRHPVLVRQVMEVLWAHENDPLVLTACIWALNAIIKHEPSTHPIMQQMGVLELLHRFLKTDSFARLPVRRYAIDLIMEIWCVAICLAYRKRTRARVCVCVLPHDEMLHVVSAMSSKPSVKSPAPSNQESPEANSEEHDERYKIARRKAFDQVVPC